MKLTRFSLLHKPVIFILMTILIILGLRSYTSLPREASPSITIPMVVVTTTYFGVAPGDIETLITQRIEKKLKEITEIKEIRSTSAEGFSSIQAEFNPDIDIDEAVQKVREKVDLARPELPEDADDPIISEINFSDFPIMLVNISGDYGLVRLKKIAEDLEEIFETVPGVLDVKITGGLEREVKINVDLDRMKYYGISFQKIIDAVRDENTNIPGGAVEVGRLKYTVRVPGEFSDPSEINDIIVKVVDGKPIYIKDVATVEFGFKDRTSYARQNGVECITLSVVKRSGENIIQVADGVKAKIQEVLPTLPPGTRIDILADQSKMIHRMVNELENNIISGLILVVGVLFLFLGFRNSVLVAVSIPLSMLISFIVIQAMGYTLNMVVLFSLILALGMLVDNAIVIVENIYRHREEGYPLLEAAYKGTKEVGAAIVASTITTLCAFAPMLFWPGIMGEFMRFLPITLIITLASSLFVAIVFNPVFAGQFMKLSAKQGHRRVDHLLNRVIAAYEKTLRYALNHGKLTILGSFAVLIFIIILYGFLGKGVEFFPDVDPQQIYVEVTAPIGTNIEESNAIVKQIEEKLPPFLGDVKSYTANVGFSMQVRPSEGGGGGTPHKSRVTIDFVDREYRKQSSRLTMEQIREAISRIPGARIDVEKQRMGPPTGPPVNIEIAGEDFDTLGELARRVRLRIRNIPGLVDLRDDYDTGRPELRVVIDREKANLYNLNTAKIARTIRTAINGTKATKYRVNEDEYDIRVRLDEKWRQSLKQLEQLVIFHEGKQIPITSVAHFEMRGGLANINRKDLKRVVTVSGNVQGRLANDVLADVQRKLKSFQLPAGYSIAYTGENEDQEESKAFLSNAFLIALLLIFLVLVYEFNSVAMPFVIMLSVVLSLIGVLLGLLVTRLPFGIIMTGIGVISLAGVVVNNAIVLLDYTLQLRAQGLSKYDAIIKAGKTRFRPVLLTAITTILGLIPLTTGLSFDFFSGKMNYGGESSQWWGPMGVAVIFGLAFSTFLTLVVVPVTYSILDSLSERVQALVGIKKEELTESSLKALPESKA